MVQDRKRLVIELPFGVRDEAEEDTAEGRGNVQAAFGAEGDDDRGVDVGAPLYEARQLGAPGVARVVRERGRWAMGVRDSYVDLWLCRCC